MQNATIVYRPDWLRLHGSDFWSALFSHPRTKISVSANNDCSKMGSTMQGNVLDADNGVAGVIDMAMIGVPDFGVVDSGGGSEDIVTVVDRENM